MNCKTCQQPLTSLSEERFYHRSYCPTCETFVERETTFEVDCIDAEGALIRHELYFGDYDDLKSMINWSKERGEKIYKTRRIINERITTLCSSKELNQILNDLGYESFNV